MVVLEWLALGCVGVGMSDSGWYLVGFWRLVCLILVFGWGVGFLVGDTIQILGCGGLLRHLGFGVVLV